MYRILDLIPRPVFAPDDPGAGGDTTPGGNDTTPGAGGDDTLAGGGAGNWWERDLFSAEDREYLTARGLTVEDPLEALPKVVQAHRNAERKLGMKPEEILTRPKEGQELAEWRRENAELFGVPEGPDKYELQRPELKEGVAWDEDFERQARELGHSLGLGNADMQAITELYAGKVNSLIESAEGQLADASAAMMEELERDWGSETAGRLGIARQAAQAVAERAGLDEAAMENLASVLKSKTGDATTIRLFHAIGEMMGEDGLQGLNSQPGGMGMTPAEARQELHRLRQPGGEFYVAAERGDRAALAELRPKMERLNKIVTAAHGK